MSDCIGKLQGIVKGGAIGTLSGTIASRPVDTLTGTIIGKVKPSRGLRQDGPTEVWVDANGDDLDIGTGKYPFKTIARAMEEAFKYAGFEHMKTINIMSESGEIYEPIFVNTPKWLFRGIHPDPTYRIMVKADHPLVIAPITKASQEDFIANGGASYDKTGSSFEYTGPSLQNMEWEPGWQYPDLGFAAIMNIRFENLGFETTSTTSPAVTVFCPPLDSPSDMMLASSISFVSCVIQAPDVTGNAVGYFKNVQLLTFDSCIIAKNFQMVFDNTVAAAFTGLPSFEPERVNLLFNYKANDPNGATAHGRPMSQAVASSGYPFGKIELFSDVTNPDDGDKTFIASNFTIYDSLEVHGAGISLTNVVVKGNVNLANAGTVIWKGGSFYGTLTDPLNKMNNAVAGSYLNV